MQISVESTIENLDDRGIPYGEPEVSATQSEARVIKKDDAMVINYTEESDGGKTSTTITVFDNRILLERRGAIEWSVTFKEGHTESTVYKIPPYAFDCKVCTKRIRKTVDGSITIRLFYLMDLGGGKKNTKMKITVGQ